MNVRVEFPGDIPSIDYTPMEMEDTEDCEKVKTRIVETFGKEPVAFFYNYHGYLHAYRDWGNK